MARHRTIRPDFPLFPAHRGLGRDARLLSILLWTAADDAGRLRLDMESLVEQLFPFDPEAAALLPGWLDELERERCIERYSVDGVDYLRIKHWRKLQPIDRPTPSRLPASPSEPPPAPRETREVREAREESTKTSLGRASKAIPREEVHFSDEDVAALLADGSEFEKKEVRGYVRLALHKSLADNVHTATARILELMGRAAHLWSGHGAPTGRKEAKAPGTPATFPHIDELVPPKGDGAGR